MPSARDHPFNQSRRPLLECRSGPISSDFALRGGVDADDYDDDDDYEDICNNNNQSTESSPTTTSYGFVEKFVKASSIASSHNEKSNGRNIYNGFHDFNAIPRVNGDDGYPYGEKIINEKQPIGKGFHEPKDIDFIFSADQTEDSNSSSSSSNSSNNQTYLNNNSKQQQKPGLLLTRKLNNQHVNLFEKIGNSAAQDFSNRPLPQTPNSPFLARQRPVPRTLCPTPPLCRANRKGPFIFGVDSSTVLHSNSAARDLQPQQRSPYQWRGLQHNDSLEELPRGNASPVQGGTNRRDVNVFERTTPFQSNNKNKKESNHDSMWDVKRNPTKVLDSKQDEQQYQEKKTGRGRKSNNANNRGDPQRRPRHRRMGNGEATEKRRQQQCGGGLPSVKCVVVGDAAVGKTNLIISYLENRFLQEHIPTASDIYNGEVEVDGSPVHVTLCDTAGQDTSNASALRELCYPGSDVFLVCFSVVNPETFRSVQTNWIPKLTKQQKHASVILVGTHSDLRNDQLTITYLQMQGEKPVSVTDAWDFARSIGAKYVESSSRTKEKVKDAFDTAIWDALLSQHQSIKKPFWRRLLCLA